MYNDVKWGAITEDASATITDPNNGRDAFALLDKLLIPSTLI